MIGDIADHDARDVRTVTAGSEERMFFSQAMSHRPCSAPDLQIQPDDFQSATARKFSVCREQVFGEHIRSKTKVASHFKELCKQGWGGTC